MAKANLEAVERTIAELSVVDIKLLEAKVLDPLRKARASRRLILAARERAAERKAARS